MRDVRFSHKQTLRHINFSPLYPRKQTSFGTVAMSALCHSPTHPVQQKRCNGCKGVMP